MYIIKKSTLSVVIFLFWINLFCQEVMLQSRFAIRDFLIVDNTILYIEKRNIKSVNIISKQPDTIVKSNGYFIGGYGLNIFHHSDSSQVVTSSNELVKDRSSIRFYDIVKGEVNKYHVYYTTKLMDISLDFDQRMLFLSKKNLFIEIFKYGGKPRYKKLDSIKLDSYSRRLRFYNNKLYYITDSGKVFEYNLITRVNRLLYQNDKLLINFIFDKKHEIIYMTSYDGKVIEVNIDNPGSTRVFSFGNEIIEAINIFEDKYLIAGDWLGEIKVIDLKNFSEKRKISNKKRIIKIEVKGNCFYASSADKTIKKWKID